MQITAVITVLILVSKGKCMDLYPKETVNCETIFPETIQALLLQQTEKVNACMFTDLPEGYFDAFREHEKAILNRIVEGIEPKKVIAKPFDSELRHDLPIHRICEIAAEKEPMEGDFLAVNGAIKISNRIPGYLLVHCYNIHEYDPLASTAHGILHISNSIFRRLDELFCFIKEHIQENVIDSNEYSVDHVVISGHLAGSAIAQLLTIYLTSDPDIMLAVKRPSFMSVSFGEHRIFSPFMIAKIAASNYDANQHLVFSGLEHWFAPNFGTTCRFGRVLNIKLTSIFDNKNTLIFVLESLSALSSNPMAFNLVLANVLEEKTSMEVFSVHSPALFYHVLQSTAVNASQMFPVIDAAPYIVHESFSESFLGGSYLSPSPEKMQKAITRMMIKLQNVFTFYHQCLKDQSHRLVISEPVFTNENAEILFTVVNNENEAGFEFLFSIYFARSSSDMFPEHGFRKIKRESAFGEIFDPDNYMRSLMKKRYNLKSWAEFFRLQWSNLSGEGALNFKKINPFFEESTFFSFDDCPDAYAALLIDPKYLFSKLVTTDPKEQRLVKDLFGPVKRDSYIDFRLAQSLFQSPPAVPDQQSLLSYVIAKNTLLDLVRSLFAESSFPLMQLIEFDGVLEIGDFVFMELTSYHLTKFQTTVTSEQMTTKLVKTDCLHSCCHGLVGRHCPYFSLRTPNNPFWKRVIRVKDLYMAFIGSDSFKVFGDGKLESISKSLGSKARPLNYSMTGSFRVLEVYSKVKGFGPGGQQGTFYMLLIQDPLKVDGKR